MRRWQWATENVVSCQTKNQIERLGKASPALFDTRRSARVRPGSRWRLCLARRGRPAVHFHRHHQTPPQTPRSEHKAGFRYGRAWTLEGRKGVAVQSRNTRPARPARVESRDPTGYYPRGYVGHSQGASRGRRSATYLGHCTTWCFCASLRAGAGSCALCSRLQ